MLAVGRKTQPLSSNSNALSGGPVSASSTRKTTASCRLSLYELPPRIDVDVEQFETYGIARLQVLRRIDVLQARGVKGDKLYKEINKADVEQLFHGCNDGNKDLISHYILRMAYCRTEELRRWFLTNECLLFKIRFHSSKSSDVDKFLRDQKMLLKYPPISEEEKIALKPKLLPLQKKDDGKSASDREYFDTVYYKVPFMDVLPLVSRREVYLESGFAYVSRSKILSIVEGKFRTSLSKSLAQATLMQFRWSSDTRIGSIINRLSKVAFQYGGSTGIGKTPNGAPNNHAVAQIFTDYLKNVMGHSDPKMKPAGVNKMFVSVGTKKANACDKTCPIANRLHKSNTQKYTIYFDTLVMEQGCWDGVCQATNRHVYYQIRDNGRCVKVGWNPPPLDPTMIANAVNGLGCGGCASNTAAPATSTTPVAKKMKLSATGGTTTSMQVSP